MSHYLIKVITDKVGQEYLVSQPSDMFMDYSHLLKQNINKLKENLLLRHCDKALLQNIDIEQWMLNQANRDNQKYHVTIMPVMFWNKISQEEKKAIIQELNAVVLFHESIFEPQGIGCQFDKKNIAIFEVLKPVHEIDEILSSYREKYKIPLQDYHMTLGFSNKDVRGNKKEDTIFISYENHFVKKNHMKK